MMFSINFTSRFTFGVFLLRSALSTPVSTTTTTSYAGMWDATISPSLTSSASTSGYSSTTCSRSICVDNVNECGQMYGGCFLDPACTGGTVWPTFSKPPCPSSASKTCTESICADYVNECGIWYGGCFLDPKCTGGTAWPTFVKPPCPTYTSSSSISSSEAACTRSICADGINSCGIPFGGCFLDPACTGGTAWPTFTTPPCPSSSSSQLSNSSVPCSTSSSSKSSSIPDLSSSSVLYPSSSSSVSATCTQSICVDSINECGIPYGGCFLDPKCTGGTAFPTFSKPPCPSISQSYSVSILPTVTAITTIIHYTTTNPPADEVTVILTSTSTNSVPAAPIFTNGSLPNTTAPTTTPPVPNFTGAGARNLAETGALAIVIAVGVIFL